MSSDSLVMYVISTSAVATPSGWTLSKSYNWTTYAYYSYVFTRQKGSGTSVTVSPAQGGAMIVAYQNTTGIGAVGTFKELTGATLPMNSITPQNAGSLVLGILSDRDTANPTPPSGFTTRLNYITTYFGQNFADKVFGSTSPTGNPVWGQGTTYVASGVLIELLPAIDPPTITAAFSPASILSGTSSTLTFNVGNSDSTTLTNANFTATLVNMSVANSTIGGTCAAVTNSPALTAGATALNLTIPSLPSGGCTVTVQVTSANMGTNPLTTSGVTTTQTPTAGSPSNTANLTVTNTPNPATIQSGFAPAWMASGDTSTLTLSLGSPSQVALTNAQFTATLSSMTVASAAIGGTCAGTTNSPALTVGATSLNMTVPTVPGVGCTVTVQVTSTTLGSNLLATSGVTVVEVPTTGAPAPAAYLTVNPVSVGFSYVHPDHLGTPKAITRPSDNAKVWEWGNTDPFGANLPNENPSGFGAFAYNLRFPGQFYDQETGTHYNYFRDYDPSTGRYIESDPIGLLGGINTFAYATSSPLRRFDPRGLWSGADFKLVGYFLSGNGGYLDISEYCDDYLSDVQIQVRTQILKKQVDNETRSRAGTKGKSSFTIRNKAAQYITSIYSFGAGNTHIQTAICDVDGDGCCATATCKLNYYAVDQFDNPLDLCERFGICGEARNIGGRSFWFGLQCSRNYTSKACK